MNFTKETNIITLVDGEIKQSIKPLEDTVYDTIVSLCYGGIIIAFVYFIILMVTL